MQNLEQTLHLNRDWALKRIHTLCESNNYEDVIDGYAIALEYKAKDQYDLAMENLKIAQKYVPSSSDLNKLIHTQMEIIQEKLDDIEGL